MKNIFELIDEEETKVPIEFDEYLDKLTNEWKDCECNENTYSNNLIIMETEDYCYYLSWDNNKNIESTHIHRYKK